jgi:serralysin
MSGSSGLGVRSVARINDGSLSAADNQNIASLLTGSAWNSTTITYSFPTSSSVYGTQSSYGDPAPYNGFGALSTQQRNETQRALYLISSYTNLTFAQITETTSTHAALRLANSSSPPTAYAYYPATTVRGGDIFFGSTGRNPAMGNFDSGQAVLHEIGHAVGLKHGQDNNTYGVMNANRLDIEFSLMNYANYIGSADGFGTSTTSSQTYMMYDIAALQYMYGANWNQVGANNTYTWSSTTGAAFINGSSQGTPVDNHIFSTIWTAGATSTYDLSNFSQNQVIDMQPGGWMLFSSAQLADLNARAHSKPSGEIYARGNVYNALLYNGDTRSLIGNVFTGAGNDSVTGNAANNAIHGGGGADTLNGLDGADFLDGGTGNDFLIGGTGADSFYTSFGYGQDTVADFIHSDGDKIDFTAFNYVHNLYQVYSRSMQVGANTFIDLGGGDTLTLSNFTRTNLVAGDFKFQSVTIAESVGATAVAQVGNGYFLDSSNGALGPQLRQGGSAFTVGSNGNWRMIGAEQQPNGYAMWWRNGIVDQYMMWSSDLGGNVVSGGPVVNAISYRLQSLEGAFGQDLNSDGTIGTVSTVVESAGATNLARVGDLYFMYQGSGSSGASLRQNGDYVVWGSSPWSVLGVERWSGGYQVAWKNGTANEYAIWTTDIVGNFWSSSSLLNSSSYALQSLETPFGQDLNGDGTTGVVSAAIETVGTTKLARVADFYFMYQGSGATGVVLQQNGSPAMAVGSPWTALGAEQWSGGYQVVWKNGSANQYALWTTDLGGNLLASSSAMASGSYALESLETAFGQDLNGDGTTGVVSFDIETSGAAKLARVADFYFMYQGSGSTGAVLRQNGNYVVAGSGAWTPLGAERWSGGYQVVWKNGSADQYALWTTDMDGNFLSSSNVMSGSSATLRALEASFNQDFNANGTVGSSQPFESAELAVENWAAQPDAGNVSLFTNYMAAAFATPAGEGAGTGQISASDQDFLAKPMA